jgi:hypothetical protein
VARRDSAPTLATTNGDQIAGSGKLRRTASCAVCNARDGAAPSS